MNGKICLITGATDGIGAVTALQLARQGATVIGAGRDRRKADAVIRRIRQVTGSETDYLLADLSSQSGVRQLAADFHSRYDRLDVLVNNAGAYFLRRQVTVDGLERTFALNHLAYFLLTHLLLDRLKTAAIENGEARVINVASAAHYGARLDFDNLQLSRGFTGGRAYGRSKLANVLFTYELARRLSDTAITANALHPGFVATGFAKNNGWLVRLAMVFIHRFALSPNAGARTSVYLACSPQVKGVSGKYFYQGKAVPSDPASYNEEAARRLWQVSVELTGI